MTMVRVFSAAAAFGLFALSSGALEAALSPDDCSLSFEPAAVSAGDAMIEVQATSSEDVEGVERAVADSESGLGVALTDAGSPFELTVDARDANPGEWTVALLAAEGEEPLCTGTLIVN